MPSEAHTGSLSEAQVLEALRPVEDPEIHRSIVELNMVRGIEIDAGNVKVTVALTVAGCPMRAEIIAFLTCIVEDTPEPVSARAGIRALAAAVAVLESAERNVIVRPAQIAALAEAGSLERVA